jgi:transcription termination/antitermination protein NusA
VDALDVDDVIAHLLVTEGFGTIEEIAYVPLEELAKIEGFDEDVARELSERAQAFLARQNEELDQRRREIGVADDLAAIDGITPAMMVKLGEAGVKSLDDLADLASDELIEIVGSDALDTASANTVIMAARAHWFEGDGAQATEAQGAA